MFQHLSKHWKIYLYSVVSLVLFVYVGYNYGRLDDMSNREAGVYGAALALAIVFILMPFSKLIKIGYFVIIPWLFNKTEQLDQDVAEAKETAIKANRQAEQAYAIAQQAQETAEKNAINPMTSDEADALIERIKKRIKNR